MYDEQESFNIVTLIKAGERSGAAVIRWVEKEMRIEWQNCDTHIFYISICLLIN